MALKKKNLENIETAFSFFTQGNSESALTICQSLLKNNKKDVNALHLTAIIKDKLNQKNEALDYFKKAVKLAPNNPDILTNTGISCFEQSEYADAEKYLKNALKIDPSSVQALFNLGNVAYKAGNKDVAIDYYKKTIEINSKHAPALSNLANIYFEKQQYEPALNCASAALKLMPNSFQNLLVCAKASDQLNKIQEAINYYDQLIKIKPDNVAAGIELAKIYIRTNSAVTAIPILENALKRDKNNYLIHHLLAIALKSLDTSTSNLEKILVHLKKSLELNPAQENIFFEIGVSCIEAGEFDEAITYLKKFLSLEPDNAEALNALGTVYQETGDIKKSITHYEQAIEINPDNAQYKNNLGYLYTRLEKLSQATHYLQQAIKLAPTDQKIQNNLSMLELLTGDFVNGWQHYRYRNSVQQERFEFPPEAIPQSIAGKKVLILSEQGIGDELFFLRFMPQLSELKAEISYLPCQKLQPILKPLNIVNHLLQEMPDKHNFDICFSVGDLPYLLKHDGSATPPPLALKVDEQAIHKVSKVLEEFGPPPYIGLTWQAGGIINNRRSGSYFKEIDIESLCKIAKNLPGSIIAVQKNTTRNALDELSTRLGRPVLDASIYHDDLEKQLALLNILDHYIAVSNTNIHLREGIGKPNHVLVCSPPEWRWMNSGKSSPWFPCSAIYRQSSDLKWDNAIKELNAELKPV